MPSLKTSVALLATAVFTLVQAQITYEIDPNSVPLATRVTWCNAQKASCPLLCLQLQGTSSTTTANSCDPATLDYVCTCGNGQAPSASSYSQTIPYFECTEYGNQCVAACPPGDSTCQTACRVNNLCGAQNPPHANSSSSTTATASSTAAPSGTGNTGTGSTGNTASNTGTPSSGADSTGKGGSNGAGSKPTPTPTGASGSSNDGSKSSSGGPATLDHARSYGLAVVFAGLFAGFALVL